MTFEDCRAADAIVVFEIDTPGSHTVGWYDWTVGHLGVRGRDAPLVPRVVWGRGSLGSLVVERSGSVVVCYILYARYLCYMDDYMCGCYAIIDWYLYIWWPHELIPSYTWVWFLLVAWCMIWVRYLPELLYDLVDFMSSILFRIESWHFKSWVWWIESSFG